MEPAMDLVTNTKGVSVERLAELENLEEVIRKNWDAAAQVAEAFAMIKEKKLYASRCRTWRQYIDECWREKLNFTRADRMIDAFHVQHALESSGAKVEKLPVRAVQKIRRLGYNKQVMAWDAAQKLAQQYKPDARPETKHIEQAIEQMDAGPVEPIEAVREAAADFKALIREVQSLVKRIEELSLSPWGDELASRIHEVRAGAEQAVAAVKQTAPYALCYCVRGCRLCKNRKPRWISRAIYRAAPEEIREKMGEHV